MAAEKARLDVYVEVAQRRAVAVAADWPGWCRSASDEAAALAALVAAAPRYAAIVAPARLAFVAPRDVAGLNVCARFEGNAPTVMGVPEGKLPGDAEPMSDADVERATKVLRACWDAFDRAIEAARGKELRKGPRGGGRELEGIARHVAEAEGGYARMAGAEPRQGELVGSADLKQALAASHARILDALAAAAQVGVPPPGPRGGARWPARYFVRRVAYHVVDHTWEIEDRGLPAE